MAAYAAHFYYFFNYFILFAPSGAKGVDKVSPSRPVLGEPSKFIPGLPCLFPTYHQLKYSSPNRSKTPKPATHKRAYLLENGGLREKEVRRMGQKQKRIRPKEQQD